MKKVILKAGSQAHCGLCLSPLCCPIQLREAEGDT